MNLFESVEKAHLQVKIILVSLKINLVTLIKRYKHAIHTTNQEWLEDGKKFQILCKYKEILRLIEEIEKLDN